MSQFIKMGEISMDECHSLEELVGQKNKLMDKCNLLQAQDPNQYEAAKLQLKEMDMKIKKQTQKIMIDYKIEIIPGANIRVDFENGDILAVLPEEA